MSNKDLYRNAEGYADPTAYPTLSQKEPGDVWTYDDTACLIIKNHGRFSTILVLHNQKKHPNQVEVMTKDGPKYADPRLLSYGFHDRMTQYIDTVSAGELGEAVLRTEEALGIDLQTGANPVIAELREKLDAAEGTIGAMRADIEGYQTTIEGLNLQLAILKTPVPASAAEAEIAKAKAEATKAKNQLELLREMYNDLLAKVAGEG